MLLASLVSNSDGFMTMLCTDLEAMLPLQKVKFTGPSDETMNTANC